MRHKRHVMLLRLLLLSLLAGPALAVELRVCADNRNIPPLVYANVLRFEAAVQRLTQTAEPVGDVSHELGFSAPSHFSRFFRAHLGITPSDYRRKVNLFEPPRGSRSDVI